MSFKCTEYKTKRCDQIKHISLQLSAYDIITLSETWLTSDISDDAFTMKGYQPRKDRSSRYIGGVVATWISNKLIPQRRRDLESPDIEGLWLEIRSNNSNFPICTIYRYINLQTRELCFGKMLMKC